MAQLTSESLGGIGQSVKRKEDLRFIQGKGKYIEDFYLPNMVYGVFTRSPYAHAKIKGINSEAALKVPGVLAVVRVRLSFSSSSFSRILLSDINQPASSSKLAAAAGSKSNFSIDS